mmetsp:Transcript_14823/g.24684  ORF Transcript_14823/g.24684 Transcript_14823/m.24684 type:complete len:328 (-) Transcript_14823:251-1234(-)
MIDSEQAKEPPREADQQIPSGKQPEKLLRNKVARKEYGLWDRNLRSEHISVQSSSFVAKHSEGVGARLASTIKHKYSHNEVARLLCDFIESSPEKRIHAGSCPPWDIPNFYSRHPDVLKFKVIKFCKVHPKLLRWVDDPDASGFGWITLSDKFKPSVSAPAMPEESISAGSSSINNGKPLNNPGITSNKVHISEGTTGNDVVKKYVPPHCRGDVDEAVRQGSLPPLDSKNAKKWRIDSEVSATSDQKCEYEATCELLIDFIKAAPDQRISAGAHPPWDLVNFYLQNPSVNRVKPKKLCQDYSMCLYWLEDENASGLRWICYSDDGNA